VKIEIIIEKKLGMFQFFEDWIDNAQKVFETLYFTEKIISHQTICIDQNGLVCYSGKQFKEAKYPVVIYKTN